MTIPSKDLDRIRGLVSRVGTDAAARLLGVHKTSVISALAGLEIRPRTEKDIREALDRGVTDSDTVRGERRNHTPTTKRRA